MLSRCFFVLSLGEGAFVTGLSLISSFFSYCIYLLRSKLSLHRPSIKIHSVRRVPLSEMDSTQDWVRSLPFSLLTQITVVAILLYITQHLRLVGRLGSRSANRCVIDVFGGVLCCRVAFLICPWVNGLSSQDWVRSLPFSHTVSTYSDHSCPHIARPHK